MNLVCAYSAEPLLYYQTIRLVSYTETPLDLPIFPIGYFVFRDIFVQPSIPHVPSMPRPINIDQYAKAVQIGDAAAGQCLSLTEFASDSG